MIHYVSTASETFKAMERVANMGTLSSNKLKMQNFQYGNEPPQFTSMNQ